MSKTPTLRLICSRRYGWPIMKNWCANSISSFSTLSPPPSIDTTLWNPSKRNQILYSDVSEEKNLTRNTARICTHLLPKRNNANMYTWHHKVSWHSQFSKCPQNSDFCTTLYLCMYVCMYVCVYVENLLMNCNYFSFNWNTINFIKA